MDDLILSESRETDGTLINAFHECMKDSFGGNEGNEVKFTMEPNSIAGYRIDRDRNNGTLTLSMEEKILEAVRTHMPELLETDKKPDGILTGTALHEAADALRMPDAQPLPMPHAAKRVQKALGSIKFPEKGCIPALTLLTHRLSCVAKYPPPEATAVVDGLIYLAYQHRSDGLTFGGKFMTDHSLKAATTRIFDLDQRSPADLSASGDASPGFHNVYSILIMYGGAALMHATKKCGLVIDSTMKLEQVATQKTGELIEYLWVLGRATGLTPPRPTVLATDNLPNMQVTNNIGSSTRSRSFLERYKSTQQRIKEGILAVVHVRDENMPADFLTKWVAARKLNKSLTYATGGAAKLTAKERKTGN